MSAPVYVLGGYQTDFARNWNKEGKDFSDAFAETVSGTLDATSLEPADIDVAHVGNFAAELYCNQGHLGGFFAELDPAFAGVPAVRHEAACAS
ncbi:MAG: thiolase domain-containing protein, partial [Chloroflexi bacterium]|nr:thiolase domain-containing protein [Chloroflexota bacterium]